MGRFNTPRWVSREEYDEWAAGHGEAPTETATRDAMEALLTMVDPNMAEKVRGLDAAGAAEFRAELEAGLPDALKNLAEVRTQIGVDEPKKTAAKKPPAKKAAARKTTKRAPKKS
jgi:hypothetical protein